MDLKTLDLIQGSQREQHDEVVPFLAERLVRTQLARDIARRASGWDPVLIARQFDHLNAADRHAIAELVQNALRDVASEVLTPTLTDPVLMAMVVGDQAVTHRVCGFQLAQLPNGRVVCLACDRDVQPADRLP